MKFKFLILLAIAAVFLGVCNQSKNSNKKKVSELAALAAISCPGSALLASYLPDYSTSSKPAVIGVSTFSENFMAQVGSGLHTIQHGLVISNTSPLITNSNCSLSNFTISPSLPAGLTLDSSTGKISGTPTATSSATTYTVSASFSANGGAAQTISSQFKMTVYTAGELTCSTQSTCNGGTYSCTAALAITNVNCFASLTDCKADYAACGY